MKIWGLRQWVLLVLCYWLVVGVVVALEIRYMQMTWAGLPGAVITLPLSVLVVTYFLAASFASERGGYNVYVIDVYDVEYGFLVCAFLNAFIFYPFYWWWTARRRSQRKRELQQPPPPPAINL